MVPPFALNENDDLCCGPLLQGHSPLVEQGLVLFNLHRHGWDPLAGEAGSPCEFSLAPGCEELPPWGAAMLALLRRSCHIPPSHSLLFLQQGPTLLNLFFQERLVFPSMPNVSKIIFWYMVRFHWENGSQISVSVLAPSHTIIGTCVYVCHFLSYSCQTAPQSHPWEMGYLVWCLL